MSKRIAIVGCGAIGSLYAAHLARVAEVWVVTRRPEHARAINEHGIRVSGTHEFHSRPRATCNSAELPECEFAIVATKIAQVRDAFAPLGGRFDRGAVLSAQNGFGSEEILAALTRGYIMRGTTFMSGTRHSDTHVQYELDTPTWMGPFEKTNTPLALVEELADLIVAGGLKAIALEDARPAQWSKLLFNSAVNGVSALTELPHSPHFADRSSPASLGHLLYDLLEEGKRVAAALGVMLQDDPWEMNCLGAKTHHPPSMLYDIQHHQPTEVEYLAGAVAREAERAGVPAPLHAAIYRMIKAKEESWKAGGESSALGYPIDKLKLDRVHRALAETKLDAVVVRAPDNVVYLTNYWPMKGYDIAIFPREGEPTLLVIEPQLAEAQRTAWTSDVRAFRFYHPSDPRPPTARATDMALEVLHERGLTGCVGLELSQNSQICDRMVGEPTVYTQGYFDAFRRAAREVADATPLLAGLRMIKTEQEISRMRLANELAAIGMEHARDNIRPGVKESEVAAMIEGHIHAVGVGYKGVVEMARAFTLVWSGQGIATFTPTSHRPVVENEPTLVEIWVCADGYWTDLTKNIVPGKLTPRYNTLLEQLLAIFNRAVSYCRDGAALGEIDRIIRQGIADAGYPGQPSHPVGHGVGARAHEPPYCHQAAPGVMRAGMVLAIEPGLYWGGGGGLRLEDNFLITADGCEKLCSYPDDFRH